MLTKGTTPIVSISKGSTPIVRVTKGTQHIWPLLSANFLGFQMKDASAGQTVLTFPFTWGSEHPSRRILVAHGGPNTGTPSDFTVGGEDADLIYNPLNGAWVQWWIAHLPEGESGDVVITLPSADSRRHAAAWAVYGLKGNTPHDTDTIDGTDALSISLDVPPGGLAFAGVRGLGTFSNTWSAGVDEDYDGSTAGSSVTYSGGHRRYRQGAEGLTVTTTQSASGTRRLSGVSFGP